MTLAHTDRHSWLRQLDRTWQMRTVNWVPLRIIVDCGTLDVSTLPTLAPWPVGVISEVHVTYWDIHLWDRVCSRALTLARSWPR